LWDADRCTLRSQEDIFDLGVELDLGSRAESLDLRQRAVILSDGRSLSFDGLVIATGASPRALRGLSGRPDVFSLRTLDDALAIRAVISSPGARLLIAGAGFIGLEVASTARGLGSKVTVVDPCAIPLESGVGPVVGRVFESMHRGHGVDLHLDTTIDKLETGTHSGLGVRCRLSDATVVEADALLVAVGVSPATSWLEGSGLELTSGGLSCDASLVAAPGVVAAGDIARWPNPLTRQWRHIEHRTNASEQAEHAARSLLAGEGARPEFAAVPYFWSDQYGHKIQVLGSPQPGDETVVVDGTLEELAFVVLFGRSGRLSGALGFSRAKVLMNYLPLLEAGASFADALAFTPS